MMTSNQEQKLLCSLLFETLPSYTQNLKTLLSLIENSKTNSIIVAPEVCLTGFAYDDLENATTFANEALTMLQKVSFDKCIIFTLLEKIDGKIYNNIKIIYNGEIVHSRAKARLFKIGDEHKYMQEGKDKAIELVNVGGLKIALFICFELRFKELWKKAEGADVVAVSSWWGVSRTEHFNAFVKTLAIMNQCYVVASDSKNDECTKMSSIVTPKGNVHFNGNTACLEIEYKQREIDVVRRFIDVGMGTVG